VGVELVREIAACVKTPFFAIGGITLDNIGEVLEAGATRVAVVSAILQAPVRTTAARAFSKRLA
jgi:thiamine-phosphate pyrophosphorylase